MGTTREQATAQMNLRSLRYGEMDFPQSLWEAEPVTLFQRGWSKFNLATPPANDSQETEDELNTIALLHSLHYLDRREEIERQDRLEVQPLNMEIPGVIEIEFLDLLESSGEDVPREVRSRIAHIASQLTTVGLRFKRVFNRPRPYQLLNALGRTNFVPPSETALSASYPSTHALIGNFLGWYLGRIYPQHASELAALGKRLGDNRVVAGWHFPSDEEAGRNLAKYLRSYLKP